MRLRDALRDMIDAEWKPGAEWLERAGQQQAANVLMGCASDVLNAIADDTNGTLATHTTGKELVRRLTKEMSRQARATGTNPLGGSE